MTLISDFARRRQSLKSKCGQIITRQGVCTQINTKHRPEFLLFHKLSSLAKCKVREKTTPRQLVKNKVCETLSDLGYCNLASSGNIFLQFGQFFKGLRVSNHKVRVSNYLVWASNPLLVIPKKIYTARSKKVRVLDAQTR